MPIARSPIKQITRLSRADDLNAADPLSSNSTHSQQDCRRNLNTRKTNTKSPRNSAVLFAPASQLLSVAPGPSYELSFDVINELWWSPEEQNESSKQRKMLIKQFLADQQKQQQQERQQQDESRDVEDKFVALYKSCATMNVSQVLRFKNNKQLLLDVANAEGVRGLEVKLSKTVSAHRKLHVRSMLSALGRHGEGSCDDLMSGARSSQVSRASDILARVLAQVDFKEATML